MDEETIIDQPQESSLAPPEAWDHAGFWVRLVAHLIDSIIVLVGSVIVVFVLGFIGGGLFGINAESLSGGVPGNPLAPNILFLLLALVYFAGMESSTYQGTLGKRALSLRVVDNRQQQISFPQAMGRYFVEAFLSPILFIGYLMIAFDSCKRGLHDRLAGTYVL